jgi:hypothetical protein
VALLAGRRAIALGGAPVTPDRERSRPGATLVEASVTARLLGLRILTLDATMALVPADVTVTPARVPRRATPALTRPSVRPPGPQAPAGHRLADAVRTLDEGTRLLAEVHRNGAGGRR